MLGLAVGRRTQGHTDDNLTPEDWVRSAGVDLVDRADRVKDLLRLHGRLRLAGGLLRGRATVNQLTMGYLGIPLLDAAEVVQELADAVNVPMPDADEQPEPDVEPAAG